MVHSLLLMQIQYSTHEILHSCYCADYFPFGDRAGDITIRNQRLTTLEAVFRHEGTITLPTSIAYYDREYYFVHVCTPIHTSS